MTPTPGDTPTPGAAAPGAPAPAGPGLGAPAGVLAAAPEPGTDGAGVAGPAVDGQVEPVGAPRAPAVAGELAGLLGAAAGLVGAARAANTRTAYASDWARFAGWCAQRDLAALPATPATLGAYLTAAVTEVAGPAYVPATPAPPPPGRTRTSVSCWPGSAAPAAGRRRAGTRWSPPTCGRSWPACRGPAGPEWWPVAGTPPYSSSGSPARSAGPSWPAWTSATCGPIPATGCMSWSGRPRTTPVGPAKSRPSPTAPRWPPAGRAPGPGGGGSWPPPTPAATTAGERQT